MSVTEQGKVWQVMELESTAAFWPEKLFVIEFLFRHDRLENNLLKVNGLWDPDFFEHICGETLIRQHEMSGEYTDD